MTRFQSFAASAVLLAAALPGLSLPAAAADRSPAGAATASPAPTDNTQIAQGRFHSGPGGGRFSSGDSFGKRRRRSGMGQRMRRQGDSDNAGRQAPSPFFMNASYQQKFRAGLLATGLTMIQPAGATCPEVSSAFGVTTRYDGSSRRGDANYGHHDGMDISLHRGTPLLAIASGTVMDVRTGGLLVGNQIMIKHSPRDTGTRYWMVSKYKHMREPSRLRVGQRVRAGQVIGYSGNTGTTGGHFGSRGYYHLHLSVYVSRSSAMRVTPHGGLFIPHGKFLDPLGFYRRGPYDNHRLRSLSRSRKGVRIPYKTSIRGPIMPRRSRLVWPVLCKPS